MIRSLIAFFLLTGATQALAHARLLPAGSIPPRSSSAGLKTAPCGGVVKSLTPTVLQKGSDLIVKWEETVQHPGRFEFYFSLSGETGWTLLKQVPDDQDDSGTLPHQYQTTVTLPNVDCTDCAIQMIQVMTENPANPSYYYSCADIQLQTLNGPAPQPNPLPPAPTGSHSCP